MAMTLGVLSDRVMALCAAQGYRAALHPFDLDEQPAAASDKVFYFRPRKQNTNGYLGGDADEDHVFLIYFGQRARKDSWAAERAVRVDLDLLQAALEGDFPTYDYNVLDDRMDLTVNAPAQGEDFVVGRLTVTLNITVTR